MQCKDGNGNSDHNTTQRDNSAHDSIAAARADVFQKMVITL
jgi:hypothetical protein